MNFRGLVSSFKGVSRHRFFDVYLAILVFIILFVIFLPSLLSAQIHESYLIANIDNSQRSLSEITSPEFDTGHPPLMFILHHFYLPLFDSFNPVIITFPSYLFFVGALTSLFFVSKKFFGLSAGLLSLSLFVAHNNKGYFLAGVGNEYMFVFFAILSLYFFYMSFVLGHERFKWPLVVSNILMVWSYHASAFILVGQLSFLLLHNRKDIIDSKNLKYFLTFFLFYIPIMISLFYSVYVSEIAPRQESYLVSDFFSHIIDILILRNVLSSSIGPLSYLPSLVILSGMAFSLILSFKNKKARLLLFYFLPFIVLVPLYLSTGDHHYKTRFSVLFLWIAFIMAGSFFVLYKKVMHILSTKFTSTSSTLLISVISSLLILSFAPRYPLVYEDPEIYSGLFEEFSSIETHIMISIGYPVEGFLVHFADNLDDFLHLESKIGSIRIELKHPFDSCRPLDFNYLISDELAIASLCDSSYDEFGEINQTCFLEMLKKSFEEFGIRNTEFLFLIHEYGSDSLFLDSASCVYHNSYDQDIFYLCNLP